ncbi:MAG: hypothetical protein M1830_006187 [Pleopsidium flavum]|nr:MAG: hypothetical protein M1830_006187 [Pleopsidium flavum]
MSSQPDQLTPQPLQDVNEMTNDPMNVDSHSIEDTKNAHINTSDPDISATLLKCLKIVRKDVNLALTTSDADATAATLKLGKGYEEKAKTHEGDGYPIQAAVAYFGAKLAYKMGNHETLLSNLLEYVTEASRFAEITRYFEVFVEWGNVHEYGADDKVEVEGKDTSVAEKPLAPVLDEIGMGALIELKDYKSKATMDFRGPKIEEAQFDISHDGVLLLPKTLGHDWHGVSLRLKVGGLHVCGHLLLQAVFEHPTEDTKDVLHTANLKFFVGRTHPSRSNQITNLEVHGENLILDENDNNVNAGFYTLTFSTEGGIGQGLTWTSPNITPEGVKMLEFMRSLLYSQMNPESMQLNAPRSTKHLRINVKVVTNKRYRRQAFLKSLFDLMDNTQDTYYPYLSNHGRPQCQAGQLLTRRQIEERYKFAPKGDMMAVKGQVYAERVVNPVTELAAPDTDEPWGGVDDEPEVSAGLTQLDKPNDEVSHAQTSEGDAEESEPDLVGGIIAHPAVDSYADIKELQIKLVYGAAIEQEFQDSIAKELCKTRHRIGFTQVGTDNVIAHVRLNRLPDSMNDLLLRFNEGTYMKFSWRVPGDQDQHRCTAFTMSNAFVAQLGNLTLAVVGTPIKLFEGMTVPEGGRDLPPFYSVAIEIDLDQAALKRIISAAQEFCWSPFARKFHDGYLNQDPTSLPRTDPTLCTGLDSTVIAQKKKEIGRLRRWNPQQRDVFEILSTQQHGHWSILQGLPGCGKTQALTALALFYLSIGMHVILAAPSNSATDTIIETLYKLLKLSRDPALTGLKPMRVHRSMLEKKALYSRGRPAHEEDDQTVNPVDIDELMADAFDELDSLQGLAVHRLEFQKMRSKGWVVRMTSGDDLMCGINALAIALIAFGTERSLPSVTKLSMPIDEKEKTFAGYLLSVLDTPKYKDWVAKAGAIMQTEEMSSQNNFFADQLFIILQYFADKHIGWELRLGIWNEDSNHVTVQASDSDSGGSPVIWIQHNGRSHWSGMGPSSGIAPPTQNLGKPSNLPAKDSNQTPTKSDKIVTDPNSTKSIAPTKSTVEVLSDANLTLVDIVRQLKQDQHKKAFQHASWSLQNLAVEKAESAIGKEKLMGSYFDPEQAGTVCFDGEDGPETFEENKNWAQENQVDMFAELLRYLDMLKELPMSKWLENDKFQFRTAFNQVKRATVKGSRCIVTTSNNIGSRDIISDFGHNPKGIMVLFDENSMESDAGTLMFSKLLLLGLVQGIVLCGDPFQLPPVVISKNVFPPINEFAAQLSRSPMARMLAQSFPSSELTMQYRMHGSLSEGPNDRTYNHRLQNAPSTSTLTLAKPFEKVLRAWLQDEKTFRVSDVVINVEDGSCEVEPATKSKYNLANINVVMDFIVKLVDAGVALKEESFKIVTPYRAQKTMYQQRLRALATVKNIDRNNLPTVVTANSMHGSEADYIVADWVVSSGNTRGDLGITEGEELCNVTFTRARRGRMSVVNNLITQGRIAEKRKPVTKSTVRGPPKERLPYLIDNTNNMARNRHMYTMRGLELKTQAYESGKLPRHSTMHDPTPSSNEEMKDAETQEPKGQPVTSEANLSVQDSGNWATVQPSVTGPTNASWAEPSAGEGNTTTDPNSNW